MKKFEEPMITILYFEVEDVITASIVFSIDEPDRRIEDI